MIRRSYWLIAILIISRCAAVSCAPASTPPLAPTSNPTQEATSAPSPAAATATAPGGFPAGIYKPQPKLAADRFSFHADGTYLITIGPRGVPGTYSVNGNQIVLTESSGVCLDHPGTYTWESRGSTLTFKVVKDTCTESEREADLTGRDWILLP